MQVYITTYHENNGICDGQIESRGADTGEYENARSLLLMKFEHSLVSDVETHAAVYEQSPDTIQIKNLGNCFFQICKKTQRSLPVSAVPLAMETPGISKSGFSLALLYPQGN
jgi:hypothetical protein